MVESNICRISKSDSIYIKRVSRHPTDVRHARASKTSHSVPEAENFKRLQNNESSREKIPVYMRLDEDILAYFKSEGRGYQLRINNVLRMYINAQMPE